MYRKFYGLREAPFQLTPNPRYLYMSASHQEAFAQMVLGIRMRRGFVVLSGEVGTGKTTLIRAIMQQLDADIRPALIFHTLLSAKGLLQNICKEFDLDTEGFVSKTDYVMKLHDFLQQLDAEGRTAVLIIDEAHNLQQEVLEEVRLLSNFETEQGKLLQICLVGQPELLETLRQPQMRQLNQRISLRFQLRNLSPRETGAYVEHRLAVAGLQMLGDLFTAAALEEVHRLTDGVPRRINILCENALVMGYVKGQRQITADIIKAVAYEDTYQEMANVLEAAESVALETALENDPLREAAEAGAGPAAHEAPPAAGRPGGFAPAPFLPDGKQNGHHRGPAGANPAPAASGDDIALEEEEPWLPEAAEPPAPEPRLADPVWDRPEPPAQPLPLAGDGPPFSEETLQKVTEQVLRRVRREFHRMLKAQNAQSGHTFMYIIIGFLLGLITILGTLLIVRQQALF